MRYENIDVDIMQHLIENNEVCDKVMEYLKILDEKEKEKRKILQKVGIEVAKNKHVKFGRRSMELPADFYRVAALSLHKKITVDEALERLDMQRSTFYKKRKEHMEEIEEYYQKNDVRNYSGEKEGKML